MACGCVFESRRERIAVFLRIGGGRIAVFLRVGDSV